MLNKIGETAGAVYQYMEKNGTATLAKLKSGLKANDFELSAAIGWLAREDKIDVVKSGRSIQISLR